FCPAQRLAAAYNKLVLLASALLAASLLAPAADPAAVYLANARKALEAHNVEKAKSQLNLAVEANPRSAEAWLMLAGAENQKGETARAIEDFHHALLPGPGPIRRPQRSGSRLPE